MGDLQINPEEHVYVFDFRWVFFHKNIVFPLFDILNRYLNSLLLQNRAGSTFRHAHTLFLTLDVIHMVCARWAQVVSSTWLFDLHNRNLRLKWAICFSVFTACVSEQIVHLTAQHVYTSPALFCTPTTTTTTSTTTTSPIAQNLKTFQAFSSLFSSSRQFEEGFLNDPLIIGSGVTLVFQLRLLAFLVPPSPLYLSLFFKGLFLLAPPLHLHPLPLLPPEWLLFRLFVLMKWNAAKSLRAFFFFFSFFKFRKPSSMTWRGEVGATHMHTHKHTPHSQSSSCTHLMLALMTIMFSITGEGIGKYVEVEFCGINVVTWSRDE